MILPRPTLIPPEAEPELRRLGLIVEKRLGLVFSEKRSRDLWNAAMSIADLEQRSPVDLVREMAQEGLPDSRASLLAEYLTVGETYFFREPKTLQAFEELILKPAAGAENRKRIRIWCAGCSTGEEPYTLSIILHRTLPDIASRDISILGTDINPRVLEKARRGVYSAWSFRGIEKATRDRFFDILDDGSRSVKSLFRRGVSFSGLNLADEEWRLWKDDSPPDVIFCRNVLIYFSAEQRESVVQRFYSLLPPQGWLVVAPCESSALLASKFTPVHRGGATLYRKDPATREVRSFSHALLSENFFLGAMLEDDVSVVCVSEEPYREPQFPEAEALLETEAEFPEEPRSEEIFSETIDACLHNARTLADNGRHDEALQWVRKARELDRTAPEPLYLAALISSETGDVKEAASLLRSALFLAPDFVMAHYSLGSLAMREGRENEAERHLRNAEALLSSLPPDASLREGDGIRAGELLQTVLGLRRRT